MLTSECCADLESHYRHVHLKEGGWGLSQSAQSARSRHNCKMLTVLWSGKMHMIPDNATDKILQQPVLVNQLDKGILGTLGILANFHAPSCLSCLSVGCITWWRLLYETGTERFKRLWNRLRSLQDRLDSCVLHYHPSCYKSTVIQKATAGSYGKSNLNKQFQLDFGLSHRKQQKL